MIEQLRISDNLALPLDFVTERIAFLARTGAGKSGAMRVLAEQMCEANQFFIFLDPKGDAWGIRSEYSVLIMGGKHADVPLDPRSGSFVADFLVRERISTVLDVSEFSEADMVRFVADFGDRFYRTNDAPVHWFIDEADEFAPQSGYTKEATKCLGAIQRIQRRGRGRGIGVTLATQRSAVINKSVLTQAGTLIAMQTTAPHDLKAVDAWLEFAATKEARNTIMSALPSLKEREAFVYSPQLIGMEPRRIRFGKFRSFDSMRTPKHGESRQQPKRLADIDLAVVQRDMASTIEQAKANDPKELQKTIAELKREISTLKKEVESRPAEVKEVEKPVFTDEERKAFASTLSQIEVAAASQVEVWSSFRELTSTIAARLEKFSTNGHKPPVQVTNVRRVVRPITAAPSVTPAVNLGDLKISKTQQRILDALAWYESIGIHSVSNTQLGAVALIDTSGGYFSNIVGPLATAGLLVRGGGALQLTDSGRAVATVPENVGSLDQYHDVLRQRARKMKSASGRTIDVLNAIINRGGESITTEEIGAEVGIDHTGGYFSNTIGPLSTLGLIERSQGVVTPTEILFPSGL